MKILVFTQILVMGFYGYIGKYQWDRNWSKLIKMLGKTLKKMKETIIHILKLFCWRKWYTHIRQFVTFINNI